MNWYKKASESQEQLDLFDKSNEPDKSNEIIEPEETKNNNDEINFLGINDKYLAVFNINGKIYGYWMEYEEWANKVNYIARSVSPWKALDWAKKKSTEQYELEKGKEYPYNLVIKRVIGE